MNIYITAGTLDYLITIKDKYHNEKMVTMVNENGALILHETNGNSVFKEPRKYEVFDSAGEVKKDGFVVLNNFPVTVEGRPLFEYHFKGRAKMIEKEPGFIAARFLRPLSSNTYVILTIWENEIAFQGWKNSKSTLDIPIKKAAEKGIDSQPKMFASSSYVSKYTITEEQ